MGGGGVMLLLILVLLLLGCEAPGGGSGGGSSPAPGGGGGKVQPSSKEQLLQLISERLSKDKAADLNDIDVSKVSDMSNLFVQFPTFSGNVSEWDVSHVTNMSGMFEGVTGFRGGISRWDVSKVTNMNTMFKGATKFNGDISGWDVSNVKQINSMFEGTAAFTQDLKQWAVAPAVSKVSKDVFKNSGVTEDPRWLTLEVLLEPKVVVAIVGRAVNVSITRWPVTTTGTFALLPVLVGRDVLPTGMNFDGTTGTITANAGDLKTITKGSPHRFTVTFNGTGEFDKAVNKNVQAAVSVSVKDYSTQPKTKAELIALIKVIVDADGNGIIDNATADLNSIDVSAITDMSGIFNDSMLKHFTGDISGWDVSNVKYMNEMFRGSKFTGNISGWDVSNVREMNSMFRDSQFTGDISSWVVSNVREMNNMFRGSRFNGNISNWDVKKVTTMDGMFEGATAFNQDISGWAVDAVTTMENMFNSTKAFDQDLEAWGEHIAGRTVDKTDIFDSSSVSDEKIPTWAYVFDVVYQEARINDITVLQYQNIVVRIKKQFPSHATGQYSIAPNTLSADTGLSFDAQKGIIKGIATQEVAKKAYTITFTGDAKFQGKSLVIPFSLEVKSNQGKYAYFPNNKTELIAAIKKVMDINGDGTPDDNSADLNVIYTGNITDMSRIFNESALRNFNGDISGWDVSNVTTMGSMFYKSKFNEDISKWDVSNVTYMGSMFRGSSFNGDISGWDVSNVTNMAIMFAYAPFNGDISKWDVSNVTTMYFMFAYAQFNGDISGWDVSNVTNMEAMFIETPFTGDISRWDVSSVGNMKHMFWDSSFNGDISGWDVSNVTTMRTMFYQSKVFNQNISGWNVEKVTTMYKMFNGATSFDQDLEAWGEHIPEITESGKPLDITGIFSHLPDEKIPSWVYTLVYKDTGVTVNKKVFTTSDKNIVLSIDKTPKAATGTYSVVPTTFTTDTGLTFDTATGEISGSPTVALATKEYTITFTGNGGYVGRKKSTPLTLTIQDVSAYTYTPKTNAALIADIKTVMAADADGDGNPDGNTADLNVIYTGYITDMSGIFNESALRNFNGDISGWDVSNVTTMDSMFEESKFTGENGDITSWDVGNITDMNDMFKKSSYAGDISTWDVRNVTTMNEMFRETAYNNDITLWDVRNVADMELMFYKNTAFDKDISYWNVSKVATMKQMFSETGAFNQDISSWAVDVVTTMESMFQGATAFDKDLEAWGEHIAERTVNTDKIFNTADNSGVILSDKNIPTWLYDFVLTVGGTESSTISGFVGKAIEADGAITVSKKLPTTAVGSYTISPSITDIGLSLDASTGAISGSPTKVQSTKSYTLLFSGTGDYASKSYEIPFIMTVAAGKYSYSPTNKEELIAAIKDVMDTNDDGSPNDNSADLNVIYTGNITDMYKLFSSYGDLENFNGDISQWDVSNVTTMRSMFYQSKFNGDISGWDVSNVTTMRTMFYQSKFNGDISAWDVSNVTFMHYMFSYAPFNEDISKWDVSNVTDMEAMFTETPFTGDISEWDVSSVGNMKYMFWGSSFNGDISKWKVSNVTNMYAMFYQSKFNGDIAGWAVDSVTTIKDMFRKAAAFDQDLEAWGEHIEGRTVDKGNIFTGANVSDENIPSWIYSISQRYGGNVASLFTMVKGQQNISIPLTNTGVSTFNATGDYSILPSTFTADTGLTFSAVNGTISGSPTKALALRKYIIVFTGTGDYAGKRRTKEFTIHIYDGSGTYTYYPKTKSALIANIKTVMAADADGDGNPDGNTADLNGIYTGYIRDMREVFYDSTLKSFNGDISGWDVSNVRNMRNMFKESRFTGDISGWDVSNVRYMQGMFYKSQFTGDISGWDVSDVEQMYWMFRESQFNGDISGWDVSSVGNMEHMFYKSKFNGDISNWKVSNVTDMEAMFYDSPFTKDISGWDVGNVTTMYFMFAYAQFNGDISRWNVKKVTNTDYMFNGATEFNQDISGWAVDAVTTMEYMFNGATEFNQDLEAWGEHVAGRKINIPGIFDRTKIPNDKIPSWTYQYRPTNKAELIKAIRQMISTNNRADLNVIYTGNIRDMSKVFNDRFLRKFNGNIARWDVSNVTDMNRMFWGTSFNGDISGWKVDKVEDMESMFSTSSFNGDISGWKVDKVKNMRGMFYKSKFNGDISNWNVSNVTDMGGMFHASSFNGDISRWDVSNVTDMSSMFHTSSFRGDISGWDVSNVTDMSNMFINTSFKGNISKWKVDNVKFMYNMFRNSRFNGDISDWKVGNVTSMKGMFHESSFNKDISNWDVSNVTTMRSMFYISKFNGDISRWDVSNVTDMAYMFQQSKFTGDIKDWKVGKVTDMSYMFASTDGFNSRIGGWDVSNVTNMEHMFSSYGLRYARPFSANISGWNVSKVKNMKNMFWDNHAFNRDISGWDVSSLTNMFHMFNGATAFDRDIYEWKEHFGSKKVNAINAFAGTAIRHKTPDWAGGTYTGPSSK